MGQVIVIEGDWDKPTLRDDMSPSDKDWIYLVRDAVESMMSLFIFEMDVSVKDEDELSRKSVDLGNADYLQVAFTDDGVVMDAVHGGEVTASFARTYGEVHDALIEGAL